MYIVFRDYYDRLETTERAKPPGQRRYVPTLGEIADAVGIHEVTLSKLLSGRIRSLNLDTGGKIIQTMRGYGFEMSETDLINFVPSDNT